MEEAFQYRLLPPVKATVDLGQVPGSSRARRLHLADGTQVIAKGEHSQQGNRFVLVNECICSRLAKCLDLPVPDMRIVKFEGITWFGSLVVEGTDAFTPDLFGAVISNRHEAAALAVFDLYIRNIDRAECNVLAQGMAVPPGRRAEYSLLGIDFGHSLLYTFPDRGARLLSWEFDHPRWAAKSVIARSNVVTDRAWIDEAVAKYQQLPESCITDAVHEVPLEWWPSGRSPVFCQDLVNVLVLWREELPSVVGRCQPWGAGGG
jgi:hypothetical protein